MLTYGPAFLTSQKLESGSITKFGGFCVLAQQNA
jgi:hypothetical protein